MASLFAYFCLLLSLSGSISSARCSVLLEYCRMAKEAARFDWGRAFNGPLAVGTNTADDGARLGAYFGQDITPQEFGAKDDNGVTDNTAAFQAAIDKASVTSSRVIVASQNGGAFVFGGNLVVPINVTMVGLNNPVLRRRGAFASTNNFITIVPGGGAKDTLSIRTVLKGVVLAGYPEAVQAPGKWTMNSTAIHIQAFRFRVVECHIYGWDRAITVGDNAYIWSFSDCSIRQNNYGAYIAGDLARNSGEKLSFTDCLFAENNIGQYQKWVSVSFYNCSFDYNYRQHAISVNTNSGAINGRSSFLGCHFENKDSHSGSGPQFDLSGGRMNFKDCTFIHDVSHLYWKGGPRSLLSIEDCQIAIPEGRYLYEGRRVQSLGGNVPVSDHKNVVIRISPYCSNIPNGSFELKDLGGWTIQDGGRTSFLQLSTPVYDSPGSCKIIGGSRGASLLSAKIPTGNYGKATLSIAVVEKNCSTKDWVTLKCYDGNGGCNGESSFYVDGIIPKGGGGVIRGGAIDIPIGTAYLCVEIKKASGSEDYIVVDDVYLQFD